MQATKLVTGTSDTKSNQGDICSDNKLSGSFGKSWNDIHKRKESEPSPSGGQDWKTLRSKMFQAQNPPSPPTTPDKKKEEGDQLESLRTREEYGQPAEGEDSLLKSFRNVGKAPRLLQRPRPGCVKFL